MLFRPRKAVYIGKWKLPFTPGLIPQQKDRIVRSIGNVVSNQLLNAETLQVSMLSEESLNSLRTKILELMDSFAHNEDTIEMFVTQYVRQSTLKSTTATIKRNLEQVIVQKLREADIGTAIVTRSMEKLKEKFQERLNIGFQAVLMSKESMRQIEIMIASAINDWIAALTPDIVHTEIDRIGDNLLEARC